MTLPQPVLIVGRDSGWSLETSYARAFRKLGWIVHFWDPHKALQDASRGAQFGKHFSTLVHVEPWLRKANLTLLELIDRLRPQLLLVITTDGIRAGTLSQIKVLIPETPLFCLYPDGPHNLSVERISCLPVFDRVMTSSPAWVGSFQTLGARNVSYLPFAADPELHEPGSVSDSIPRHDVAFIGNWRREREDFLEELVDFDLKLWGEKLWKQRTRPGSRLRSLWGGRRLMGVDFAQGCASNRILLNLLDTPTWPGPNMRTFEQPACRAFSLVTRTPAIVELFKEGENIECFGSVDEAREKITYYLGNEEKRLQIANAAYEFVVHGGHTYVDRAQQLVDWANTDS